MNFATKDRFDLNLRLYREVEQRSMHGTHAGYVFVTRDVDF